MGVRKKKKSKKRAAKRSIKTKKDIEENETTEPVVVQIQKATAVGDAYIAPAVVTNMGVVKKYNLIQLKDPIRFRLHYTDALSPTRIQTNRSYLHEIGEVSEEVITTLETLFSKCTGNVAIIQKY